MEIEIKNDKPIARDEFTKEIRKKGLLNRC
jgi:hypothetical protein